MTRGKVTCVNQVCGGVTIPLVEDEVNGTFLSVR
jgi:hypothetical protein